MPEQELRVCLDQILPPELKFIAEAKASAHHSGGRPGPLSAFEAAAVKAKRWRAGFTLRVRFLGGEKALQDRVANAAKEWTRHANIKFDFNPSEGEDAEIRIAFQLGAGSWSAVGTDALVEQWFPKTEPTMNYGWLTNGSTDQEVSSVVLHEFGHALGLIHEHQAPLAAIAWNKELIYRQLGGPPNNWPREKVDHNVFNRLSEAQLNFSEYDKTSIMHYFFPKEWTTDGTVFPHNTVLSETDKAFIKTQYPA